VCCDQGPFLGTYQYGIYFRVYKTGTEAIDRQLEIQFDLGLVSDMENLVAEFTTDFGTNNHIYTDGNSFELYERKQDTSLKTEQNAWPQQSLAVLQDSTMKYELSLLTEFAHALILENQNQGKFQIMVSRRFSTNPSPEYDDRDDLTQKMWLVLGSQANVLPYRRQLLPRVQYPLRFTGSIVSPQSIPTWVSSYRTTSSPIAKDLPSNIHLFTLAPLYNNTDQTYTTILRLQHLYQVNEDPTLSQPVTINLSQIFNISPWILDTLIEKTLISSINKNNLQRWVWNTLTTVKDEQKMNLMERDFSSDFIVTLNPLEIRTYQITFKSA